MPPSFAMKMGKTPDCAKCNKPVYLMEQVLALGSCYHKNTCFKCQMCNKRLEATSYAEHEGTLCCKACKNRQPRAAVRQSINLPSNMNGVPDVAASTPTEPSKAQIEVPKGVVLRRDSNRKVAPAPPVEKTVAKAEISVENTGKPKKQTAVPKLIRRQTAPDVVDQPRSYPPPPLQASTNSSFFRTPNQSILTESAASQNTTAQEYQLTEQRSINTSRGSKDNTQVVSSGVTTPKNESIHETSRTSLSGSVKESYFEDPPKSLTSKKEPIHETSMNSVSGSVKENYFQEGPKSLSEFIKSNVPPKNIDFHNESHVSDTPPPPPMFSSPIMEQKTEPNMRMKHVDVDFEKNDSDIGSDDDQVGFLEVEKDKSELLMSNAATNVRDKSKELSFGDESQEKAESANEDESGHAEESNLKMKHVDVSFEKYKDEELKSTSLEAQKEILELTVPASIGIIKVLHQGKVHILKLC